MVSSAQGVKWLLADLLGSESALSLLENCIKQATPIAPPPIVSEEVGVSSQSGGGTRGGLWGSELAALLSPTNPPSNKV